MPDGFQITITGTGDTLYLTTDGTDPRAPGGMVASGARIYTGPISLHTPTFVQARLKHGVNWSGLTAAWFVTPQDPFADTDHDGQPDAWERAYGLNPADPADRSLDGDGDGMLNWQEYVAGTDPTDPLSCLQIDAVTVATGLGATLRFRAIANQTYTVEYTDALAAGIWSTLADLPARSADREETLTDSGSLTHRFYRLVTPNRVNRVVSPR